VQEQSKERYISFKVMSSGSALENNSRAVREKKFHPKIISRRSIAANSKNDDPVTICRHNLNDEVTIQRINGVRINPIIYLVP
jgi:hypothetical protein